MVATLTFNIEDPDDNMAHKRAVLSTELALVIWEALMNGEKTARNEFEFKSTDDEDFDELDFFIRNLRGDCEEKGINIENLIR